MVSCSAKKTLLTICIYRHFYCRLFNRNMIIPEFKISTKHQIIVHRWKAESKCQQLGSDSHLASCLTESETYFLAFQKRKDDANSYFIGLSDMLVVQICSAIIFI